MTQRTNAFPDLDRDLRFIPLGVEKPQVLSPSQVRRYNEVGHLFPIDVFSPGEVAEIRAYIDDLLLKALAAGWNSYEVVNWHKSCRGIWDIVTEPRIIDVVADLLGEVVILRHSHLFAKLAGEEVRDVGNPTRIGNGEHLDADDLVRPVPIHMERSGESFGSSHVAISDPDVDAVALAVVRVWADLAGSPCRSAHRFEHAARADAGRCRWRSRPPHRPTSCRCRSTDVTPR